MGAWGTGSFENDTAADYLAELLDTEDLQSVEAVLYQAIPDDDSGGDLDADDAARALVAAEIVAAMRGFPGDMPDELAEWIPGDDALTPELRLIAHSAVLYVLNGSELRQLWEESEEFEAWKAGTRELIGRLSQKKSVWPAATDEGGTAGGKKTSHACCFCAETIDAGELITLSVASESETEQAFRAHRSCFDALNILHPRGHA